MAKFAASLALLATLSSRTLAQGFGGYDGGGGSPFSNGGSSSNDNNDNGSNGFSNNGGNFSFGGFNFSRYSVVLTAHAVLATLAFGFFFPVGGILIRLVSSRSIWIVHGLFQLFAYLLYTAAFGIGIWMISQRDQLIHNAHPIIGIVLFVLIFFQPFLGFVHHLMFKKYNKRTFWSYAHIWLGRGVITLGIINGGLGLQLAKRMPLAPPSNSAIIGYGVAAGIMWLLYVLSIFVGERRRNRAQQTPPTYKEEYAPKQQYA